LVAGENWTSAVSQPTRRLALAYEAEELVAEAFAHGLALRVLGSLGIYLASQRPGLRDRLYGDAAAVKDIDFIGLSDQRRGYKEFFATAGYEVDADLLFTAEGRRFAFHRSETRVDLFIDRLDMCHSLDLRARFGALGPSLPLADLLLQKLQIVELTQKDIRDVAALLVEHDLSDDDCGIEVPYIADLMRNDWGFHYTAVINLEKVRDADDLVDLEPAERRALRGRIADLGDAIERAPKTVRWKARAKIGARKRWYQHVEERDAIL
jgi:hypothetical protein